MPKDTDKPAEAIGHEHDSRTVRTVDTDKPILLPNEHPTTSARTDVVDTRDTPEARRAQEPVPGGFVKFTPDQSVPVIINGKRYLLEHGVEAVVPVAVLEVYNRWRVGPAERTFTPDRTHTLTAGGGSYAFVKDVPVTVTEAAWLAYGAWRKGQDK